MNLTHLLILLLQLIAMTNLSELSELIEPIRDYGGANLENQSNYEQVTEEQI